MVKKATIRRTLAAMIMSITVAGFRGEAEAGESTFRVYSAETHNVIPGDGDLGANEAMNLDEEEDTFEERREAWVFAPVEALEGAAPGTGPVANAVRFCVAEGDAIIADLEENNRMLVAELDTTRQELTLMRDQNQALTAEIQRLMQVFGQIQQLIPDL